MAAQNRNVPRSFLDDLKWVRCTFCFKPFSSDQRFFALSCRKVTCINCGMQMRSKTNRKKLNCNICKSSVDFCEIGEQMPQTVRKLFELPWKTSREAVNSYSFQQRIMSSGQKNLLSKGLRLSDNGNDAKYRTLEIKKHTEKACSVIKTYRAQLLRVMPEQNLQQLLKLNKEQLKQMNFSEMSFSSRSRRSDGRSGTLSPHHSHSRSSSKRSHASSTPNISDPSVDRKRRYSRDYVGLERSRRHSRDQNFGEEYYSTPQRIRSRERRRSRKH